MSAPGGVLGRMAKRIKSDHEVFIRKVLQKGANPVMRRAGFKRPGGGWAWFRPRAEGAIAVRHELHVESYWPKRVGRVRLMPQVVLLPFITVRRFEHEEALDVAGGDVGDLAVSIHHWLLTEGLPWFEQPLDFEAIAREREARDLGSGVLVPDWAVHACATVWEVAGRPDEAARVRARFARAQASTDEDAPF